MLSQADLIWNRACDPAFKPRLPGDRALFDVIRFDSEVNSGGLDFAIDGDGYCAAGAAAAGLRLFGAANLADFLDGVRVLTSRVVDTKGAVDILDLTDEEHEELAALGARYGELSETLKRIYETYLSAHPEDFESLDEDWVRSFYVEAEQMEKRLRSDGLIE
jgi:Domain of unknown function (DUF4375)